LIFIEIERKKRRRRERERKKKDRENVEIRKGGVGKNNYSIRSRTRAAEYFCKCPTPDDGKKTSAVFGCS
jgi:hypothetical protein